MQQCTNILLFLILHEAQHVSGDTPPIIRNLTLHKQSLDMHTWKVGGLAVVRRCQVAKLLTASDNLPRIQIQRLLVQF
jgi:hypothetical protein